MRTRPCVILGIWLTVGVAWGQTPNLGSDAQRAAGKVLYEKYCAQCHGIEGDGLGPAARRVKPMPRDFTSGKYKIRTTPSGSLPTDEDLKRIIREGMPYTSMPGWPRFSDEDLTNLVAYLKSFSADFTDLERIVLPIAIPEAPPWTEASAEKGRDVYFLMACNSCHGDAGRGEGLSAPTLVDDWENPIRAADMTKRWTFRGGDTREAIYRTFSTGMNGTPMPSYADSLTDEQRWQLVDYVYSLGESDEPNYGTLAIVKGVEDEIELEQELTLFEQAPPARFPIIGQIVQPGRAFYPSATDVEVRAIYNDSEIALMLRWNDMRAETSGSNDPSLEVPRFEETAETAGAEAAAEGEGEEGDEFWGDEAMDGDDEAEGEEFWGDEAVEGKAEEEGGDEFWEEDWEKTDEGAEEAVGYSDAVAVQFPMEIPAGIRKPYFIFGDTENPVDIWFADLAKDEPQQFVGRGSGSIAPADATEINSRASYEAGQWTVVFKRSLGTREGISFADGQYVPVAFSIWDGFNEERGNKHGLSAWFYLYLEPREEETPVFDAAKVGLVVLLVELLIVGFVRRRHLKGLSRVAARSDGAA